MDTLSLKDICLNNIKDNLSYFTYLHSSTDNENSNMDLFFLQRTYSQELLDLVAEHWTWIEEEQLDFLLNKYIINLDIDFLLHYFDNETILEKVIPIAQNLEEISYVINDTSNEASLLLGNLIPYLANVEHIKIKDVCNDKMLELIGLSCPALTDLDIQGSFVTGEGMKALCKNSFGWIQANSNIKYLNLLETPLEVEDVVFLLKYLPNLEIIEYAELPDVIQSLYLNINESNLQDATKLSIQTLSVLHLTQKELSSLLKICSKTCLNLETLQIEASCEENLSLIKDFPNLKELKLNCSKSFLPIENLLKSCGKKLKTLVLVSFSCSATVLIENCPNLKYLSLHNVLFDKLDKCPTRTLDNLNCLYLVQYENSHEIDAKSVVKLLNSSPNLHHLTFDGMNLFCRGYFNKEMLKFSSNSSLKHLSLDHCNVELNFILQFISNFNSISSLNIIHCKPISSFDISTFQQRMNDANRIIRIDFNELSDEEESDEDE